MNQDVFEFVVYMIHEAANEKNVTPSHIYQIMKKCGCIDEYMVPLYEVLHTLGSRAMVHDMEEYAAIRGYSI